MAGGLSAARKRGGPRARAGGLSVARTREGARARGRGQVAYRRLGHVTTLLESSVARPYDAAIVYNF